MSDASAEAENVAIVRRFFDELDDHHLAVMDELLAEDFTTGVRRSGASETVGGREGMKALWEEYWAAFPDFGGEFTKLVADGDTVAYFREDRGTHEGEFRGIPPTGKTVTFEYAGYFEIADGQIVHGHALGSMLDLLGQMDVELPLETA